MPDKYDRDGVPIKPPRRKLPRTSSGAFGLIADEYLRAGYLPAPADGKIVVVKKSTGYEGVITPEKVEAWKPRYWDSDVVLRPEGWLGIDVDHRDDKFGAVQLRELEKTLGPLPPTFSITSRGVDSPSRTYLFKVNQDCPRRSKAAKDIDVVHKFHRYAVTFPTIHPDTGQRYEWYSPEGEQLRTWLPRPEELPALPQAWDEYLKTSHASEKRSALAGLFEGDLVAWESWLNLDSPSPPVLDLIEEIRDEDHIGHEELFWFVIDVHEQRNLFRETGVGHAYSALKTKYFAETNAPDPVKELQDIIRWVIGADWKPREINEPPLSNIYASLLRRGQGGPITGPSHDTQPA